MSKQLVHDVENFIGTYATFESEKIAFPLALWAIATHIFQRFDCFPYLVITSLTKRSGKTRLSELISFVSSNPMNFSAMTASTLFRCISPENSWEEKTFVPPTICFDEAEMLSSESASTMRAVLNSGYRKGQTVPRTVGLRVVHFKVYCPKVFILIGDVYDTLRDRSIVISMKRGEPKKRFLYDAAKNEGAKIVDVVKRDIAGRPACIEEIIQHYETDRAQYLSDRDEEIWSPLFAICKTLCPERYRELQRLAVDLCALKTAEKKVHVTMSLFDAQSEQEEFARRMLADLDKVINGEKSIFTDEAVTKLRDLDLSPWRTFRGRGIDAVSLADLLSVFGVRPCTIRRGGDVRKGYRKLDVQEAIKGL